MTKQTMYNRRKSKRQISKRFWRAKKNHTDNLLQCDTVVLNDEVCNNDVQNEMIICDENSQQNEQIDLIQNKNLMIHENLIIEQNTKEDDLVEIRDPITGRRIVDIYFFLDQLKKFKHNELFSCGIEFLNIIKEKRTGLVSTYTIKCEICLNSAQVLTENSTSTENLEINKAAVLGIISSGGGYTQLQEIFASCNIPCMSSNFYLKNQELIANQIHSTAWSVMEKAAQEEAAIARELGEIGEDGIPIITVVADGAWCKRSYRTNYNASSGVACIVGYKTGKLLYLGIRNKYCCICAKAEHKQEQPKEHSCFKNWNKSTTSMEADIIVEGFSKSVELHGIKYGYLVGDGDSSVTKKLHETRPYKNLLVHKIECSNHLLRNYCNKLQGLLGKRISGKKTVVPVVHRNILKNNIRRLRFAVTSAVAYYNSINNLEMSEKIISLRRDILNSPNHVFGEHTHCSSYFCKGPKLDEKNNIPKFKESGLYDDILCCVNRLAHNTDSLLQNMNNNIAEQYNNVVAKFVGGKRINYSLKRSYEMRCEAAAISLNTEGDYYRLMHEALSYPSIGKFTQRYVEQKKSTLIRNKKYRAKNKLIRKTRIKKQPAEIDYGLAIETIPDMVPELYHLEKEKFLKTKIFVNNTQICHIEYVTKGQSNKKEWDEAREYRLTSSSFGEVCKMKKTTNCAKKVFTMLYKKFKGNIATRYGLDCEKNAKTKFEEETGLTVSDCGIFIDKEMHFLATSPDGLIDQDGLIEIKSSYTARNLTPSEAILQKKINYCTINNGQIKLKRNHQYYYQIQGQLNITNRNVCYFIIYTPLGICFETIYKDEDMWKNEMVPKLCKFYNDCLLPEIIDPRQSREQPLRESYMT